MIIVKAEPFSKSIASTVNVYVVFCFASFLFFLHFDGCDFQKNFTFAAW